MKTLALISGGKDSCYNVMHCVAHGHQVVALANLYPPDKDEMDSYMYQTVGHDIVPAIAECFDLPLYRAPISGIAVDMGMDYQPSDEDETEDLYRLIKRIVVINPQIKGVSVGAIMSNYQRIRVEHVANRLGLTCLAYLWNRDQDTLLDEMIHHGMHAILIKVAAIGLKKEHLGKSLQDMQPVLRMLHKKYGINVCGEGGEYESLVLDCPLFKTKRLVVVAEEEEVVEQSNDDVAFLRLKVETRDKHVVDNSWKAALLAKVETVKHASVGSDCAGDESDDEPI